jgi:hypothetical protein
MDKEIRVSARLRWGNLLKLYNVRIKSVLIVLDIIVFGAMIMLINKILRFCPITLLALMLSGCMTTTEMNKRMSSWEGHRISDLIADWGPPSQVIENGQEGKIYCYQSSGSIYMPGTTSTHGNAYTYGNQTTFNASTYTSPGYTIPINRYRMFWVNNEGVIFKWSWKGL